MALVIYPTTGWNSYLSEADATALLTANVIDLAAWTALSSANKEIYLRQSSTLIRLSIVDPIDEDSSLTTAPNDIKLATAYLANYSIGLTMINDDGKDNLKRLKIEGAIEKEWFTKAKQSNSFPDIVNQLLAQYGLSSGGTFKLERTL